NAFAVILERILPWAEKRHSIGNGVSRSESSSGGGIRSRVEAHHEQEPARRQNHARRKLIIDRIAQVPGVGAISQVIERRGAAGDILQFDKFIDWVVIADAVDG